MLNQPEASIEKLVAESVALMAEQIVHAVRRSIAAEIAGASIAIATPSLKRGRGRPQKLAAAVSADAPAAAPAQRSKRGGKRSRRSAAQLAADDARILAFVRSHAGQRSSQLEKELGMSKAQLNSGLLRLRESGRVKTKGQRRAMTYSAA